MLQLTPPRLLVLVSGMNDIEYQFSNFSFSRDRGLSEGKRHVRLPRRLFLLLQTLLEAEGDAIDVETLENVYSRKSKSPRAARISLSQNVFWLRKHLKDTDGTIVQTVLKKGFRIGVPVVRVETGVAAPQAETSLSGELTAPLSVVRQPGDGIDPPLSIIEQYPILSPANENIGVMTQADLTPESVVKKSITGAVRLVDHASRSIEALASLIERGAGTASDVAAFGWLKAASLGDLEAGLSAVDSAVELSPHSADPHFYRAWLLIASRRLEPALQQLERGLAASPRNDSLLFLKGWALCALGYHQEQEALVAKALVLHPNHLMLRMLRALGLALQGEMKRAETLLGQTVLLFPQSTLLVAQLAWLKAMQGDRQAAVKLLTSRHKVAHGYMSPVSIAAIYNVLHDEESCSAYMRIANVDQDPWRHLMWCDPRFAILSGATGNSTSSY